MKYGRALYERSGDLEDVDLGAVLFAEKRREDDIRNDGAEVVRWIWSELDGHDRTIRGRFEAAFDAGSEAAPRRLTGRWPVSLAGAADADVRRLPTATNTHLPR